MNHKIIPSLFVMAVLTMSSTGLVFAESDVEKYGNHNDHHELGSHENDNHDNLDADKCNAKDSKELIDVKQKVLNDADSGVAGNVWAFDDYKRHIQVWQQKDGTFCGIVKYEGDFVTVAGPSPSGTSTVSAGIKGEFEGGYRTTMFSGTFAPTIPTHGSIGTTNYQCDIHFNCPGYFNWTARYFTGIGNFDLAWWGWTYHAGYHGTWVNAISGNSGDISG